VREDLQVAPSAQVIVEGRCFKNCTNLRQGALAISLHGNAFDPRLAGVGINLPKKNAECGALACAVVSEQTKDFPACDFEGQPVQRRFFLKGLGEIPQFDHSGRGGRTILNARTIPVASRPMQLFSHLAQAGPSSGGIFELVEQFQRVPVQIFSIDALKWLALSNLITIVVWWLSSNLLARENARFTNALKLWGVYILGG
jgi:hypothetical protein